MSNLNIFTSHKEILNELLVFAECFGLADDLEVHGVILSLNVAFNSFGDKRAVKVGISELDGNFRVVNLLSVFSSAANVFDVVKKNFDGLDLQVVLGVDDESFFVELVLFAQSDFSDFGSIVVVKTVNVIHDFGLVALDGSDDQEVLQFLVLTEFVVVEHNLFKESDQMFREFSIHEGLHSGRNLLDFFAFW